MTTCADVAEQNVRLQETLQAAYYMAMDHDDTEPFDWAVYCEMLYQALHHKDNLGRRSAKVRERSFIFENGSHTPIVIVEFPAHDWDARDAFANSLDCSEEQK